MEFAQKCLRGRSRGSYSYLTHPATSQLDLHKSRKGSRMQQPSSRNRNFSTSRGFGGI